MRNMSSPALVFDGMERKMVGGLRRSAQRRQVLSAPLSSSSKHMVTASDVADEEQ